MSRSILIISSLTVTLLLTSCFDSGPSESEARAAYVEADTGTDYFAGFKLEGCKAATGAPGYQCDVSYKLQGGPFQSDGGRFFRAGDKWVFQRSRR